MTRTELGYALCALLSAFSLGLAVGLLSRHPTPSAGLLTPALHALQPLPITLDNA